MKNRTPASTHKKVIIVLADKKPLRGYLNPVRLGQNDPVDLLTPDGEHIEVPLGKVRSVFFVREFSDDFEPERKAFLSRPKLDGATTTAKRSKASFPTTCFPCLITGCKSLIRT